ncbi:putative heterogeneous nuclear ribonucleoprotein A1, A2/B1-like protein [Iris pallida]|uniref:Heterogeneous nuclear ribonucleoprotein A1, A2/B1-like protein n=1 Tax=Iris pallida TaxID=29817 RepID=A0AAX6EMN8_IRIPA|nr:putative heterogeneous nuclear ribonucleoprotein A1, A2/B1-like protein [Iris pallida]
MWIQKNKTREAQITRSNSSTFPGDSIRTRRVEVEVAAVEGVIMPMAAEVVVVEVVAVVATIKMVEASSIMNLETTQETIIMGGEGEVAGLVVLPCTIATMVHQLKTVVLKQILSLLGSFCEAGSSF